MTIFAAVEVGVEGERGEEGQEGGLADLFVSLKRMPGRNSATYSGQIEYYVLS